MKLECFMRTVWIHVAQARLFTNIKILFAHFPHRYIDIWTRFYSILALNFQENNWNNFALRHDRSIFQVRLGQIQFSTARKFMLKLLEFIWSYYLKHTTSKCSLILRLHNVLLLYCDAFGKCLFVPFLRQTCVCQTLIYRMIWVCCVCLFRYIWTKWLYIWPKIKVRSSYFCQLAFDFLVSFILFASFWFDRVLYLFDK